MTVVLCDFNAKSINWCKAEITSLEGSRIDRYYSEQLWLELTFSGTNSHT